MFILRQRLAAVAATVTAGSRVAAPLAPERPESTLRLHDRQLEGRWHDSAGLPIRKRESNFGTALAGFARDSHGAPETFPSLSVGCFSLRSYGRVPCLLAGKL